MSSSDYWYDDDWQENAYLDSYDLISYSLPLYNENQKIIIEGDNVDEQIDNQTLDKIEVLDAVITKFMHDRFSDAGSENTPLILFQFSTKGIYHFDSLEIPDGEEFDIGRLTVETLIPIAPTQKPCVKRFLYEFADGTVKNLSFDGGEYSETPYVPDLITWFDIIEGYEDNLTKDQMLLQIFTQSAYDLEEQVFLACDNYFDEIEKVLEHRQCPPDLMNGIYDREINHWLEEKNDRDVLDILDCICDNPNSSKSLQKKVYQKQKEIIFNQESMNEWVGRATSLAYNVCVKFGDKEWGRELFKETEEYTNYLYFAKKLSRVFGSEDPEWCKEIYLANVNDPDQQNAPFLCEIAGSIATDGLNDISWAKDVFKKAEQLAVYSNHYMILSGSVSAKDILDDKDLGEQYFQKGLAVFSAPGYEEDPVVAKRNKMFEKEKNIYGDFRYNNEFSYILDEVQYQTHFPWRTMRDWSERFKTIDDKLIGGASRQEAVKDEIKVNLDEQATTNLENKDTDMKDLERDIKARKEVLKDLVNTPELQAGMKKSVEELLKSHMDSTSTSPITFGVLPSEWDIRHIISCLINFMMGIDGEINDAEKELGNKLVKRYSEEWNINLGEIWNEMTNYMSEIFEDHSKYEQTINDCAQYVEEYFTTEQRELLFISIWQMAVADNVLKNQEHRFLEFLCDSWTFEDQIEIGDFVAMAIDEGVSVERLNVQLNDLPIPDIPEELLVGTSDDDVDNDKKETEKIEKSQSIEKSSSPPIDPIESFREFMAGEFPGMKLPKNKNYGEYVIGSGMLICFMAKKSSVSTYLYSSGKLPAKKVFEKINSLGLSGKVINDKYTLTPMPGSRNPNVVRIDIEIDYNSRDLNSAEMRAEVKDVYGQLLELCKPLA